MEEKTTDVKQWLKTGSINIFGAPFAGKDTQGNILAKLFNGVLIGGGDILRSHHDPARIEKILASGGIIPTDFYMSMILPYLSQPRFAKKPLILSAVGRSHGEEPIILQATADAHHPIKAVIYLHLTDEDVWARFDKSQQLHDRGDRSDDSRDVLKTRLQKFRQKTMPVINHYRHKGLLIEVDGTLPTEQVTEKILQGLDEFAGI